MAKKSLKELTYSFLSKAGIGIFQKVFPEYFAKEPLAPTDRYLEYPFAIQNLPKPPAKILDVGCAGSYFPLILAGFGYEVWGTDLREYAILNRIKFDNFSFVKGDIIKTGFADNFFDGITAISTIEHIGIGGRYGEAEDLAADKKAIAEITRILKPGGTIILTMPFGKAKIVRPYSRIYDAELIEKLTRGLILEKEGYYLQDANGDWRKCEKKAAVEFDGAADRYVVALLKLRKE